MFQASVVTNKRRNQILYKKSDEHCNSQNILALSIDTVL